MSLPSSFLLLIIFFLDFIFVLVNLSLDFYFPLEKRMFLSFLNIKVVMLNAFDV